MSVTKLPVVSQTSLKRRGGTGCFEEFDETLSVRPFSTCAPPYGTGLRVSLNRGSGLGFGRVTFKGATVFKTPEGQGRGVDLGVVCVSGCWGRSSTPSPDYDYNSTFYYSFYSNASHDVLEEFLNDIDDIDDVEEETVTMETSSETPTTTTTTTTTRGGVSGAASLPVCADPKTLMWILILNAAATAQN
ncbi:uncharacterized protein si:ch211-191i18.2 [Boleophthalmus pectinirostris]|uniref:uncharacterized protein si:ch211-191i18.2 n=1 Tax=Boleophthalmus pectinirostris TaxID=150288 RepID=UPI00242A8727|nr:uncharacterized protein si:ch211-191i18.2 [Boleophthalmus pectinirostris]